jgi:hypothetical protein
MKANSSLIEGTSQTYPTTGRANRLIITKVALVSNAVTKKTCAYIDSKIKIFYNNLN